MLLYLREFSIKSKTQTQETTKEIDINYNGIVPKLKDVGMTT